MTSRSSRNQTLLVLLSTVTNKRILNNQIVFTKILYNRRFFILTSDIGWSVQKIYCCWSLRFYCTENGLREIWCLRSRICSLVSNRTTTNRCFLYLLSKATAFCSTFSLSCWEIVYMPFVYRFYGFGVFVIYIKFYSISLENSDHGHFIVFDFRWLFRS